MTYQIHPTSHLSNKVNIGSNVVIGPFCNIDGDISIDDGCILESHISISGKTKIGINNKFYPFCNIGCDPQDLKFKGEDSELIIGSNNIFRENTTISKGTLDGGMVTKIGNNNLFMTGVHIAHDCIINDNNIFVNQVTLGGHVNIMNHVVIGGLSAIIQFATIGSYSMIGGTSGIDKNVLPFSLVVGNRAKLRGLNLVGIRRNNFDKTDIKYISNLHQDLKLFDKLEHGKKIDDIFINYKKILNEKLGHIQK